MKRTDFSLQAITRDGASWQAIKLKRYACTHQRKLVRGSLLVLLAAHGVAYAILGNGISAIGAPSLKASVNRTDVGVWTPKWVSHFQPSAMSAQGGAVNKSETWIASAGAVHGSDTATAYSDETGTFYTYAKRTIRDIDAIYGTPKDHYGVFAEATFEQTFTKDSDTSWVAFVVSAANVAVYRGSGFAGNYSGALGYILGTGSVFSDAMGWSGSQQFYQTGKITTLAGGDWPADAVTSTGPMTYTLAEPDKDRKNITYDSYTGTLDISSVPVGGQFSVHFYAFSYASSGFGELRPGVEAYFRDPLKSGGGITLSTEGVTPLNVSMSAPAPRDRANAQGIQSDGKIVAVGQAFVASTTSNYDFALTRYNTDGSLDTSFGTGGKVTTDLAGFADVARAVAMQSDGKLVVVGSASNGTTKDFAITRHNADGSLDTSFGNAGKVILDFASADDEAHAVAIQSDGKIVVAGSTGNSTNQDFALARFNVDGTVDTSFNGAGKVTTDFAGAGDYAYALVLQSDGKMVVAGRSDSATVTKTNFALARYNSDGTPDTSFGSGGKVTTDFVSGSDSAQALALQSDGKIVATGWAYNGTHNDFAAARYNTNGTPDTSFGNSGKVLIDFSGTHDEASAIVIQGDGKIVIGGNTSSSLALRDFAIVRLNADGSIDSGFGSNGRASFDFSSKDDRIAALGLQSDGKIVASGYANTATGDDFAMLRLMP